jgi:hypothetical protein
MPDRVALPLRWADGTHFRIVKSSGPDPDDFKTYVEIKGREPRGSASVARRRQFYGLSVLDTLDHAIAWAERFPRLGGYIAELAIPPEAPIIYEGPAPHGHGNLYNGSPEALVGHVVRVVALPRMP